MNLPVISPQYAPTAPLQAPEARMHDSGVRWFGYLIILAMFGGLGGWSAYAMLNSAAVAMGVVTVESYRQAVQHLEGGIVGELLVREGDLVQAGDVVARLDNTQFSSQLEAVRSEVGALLALEARLHAERDNLDRITFPARLVDQAGTDPRLGDFITTQTQVFTARRADLNGKIGVLQQRVEQLQEQIKGLGEQDQALVRRIALYEDEIKGLRSLFKEGMGDKVRMLAMERELAEVQGDLATVRAERSRAALQVDETKLQIDQASREFHRDVVTDLSAAQQRLFDAQERERGLEDRVARTAVRAPVAGRVVGLDVHTVGGVLRSGDRLMDIVPVDARLVIDAQVSPQDIDQVVPGLEAQLRFSSLHSRTTPTIWGRVTTVSADRLIEPKQGYPYFLARIEVPDEERARLGGQPMLPGMPVEVMIITGERTFLDYLLRPLTDALARSLRSE